MIGVLYLLTAVLGALWAVNLTLTGLYGVPFSWWYVVVFMGSVVLLIGGILWWVTAREWTYWLPIVGSAMLASYFVPAIITTVRQLGAAEPTKLLIRVATVGLVIASLLVAISNRLHFRSQ
jgi:hypothetical protein